MTAKGHMLLSIPVSILVDKILHVHFFTSYNVTMFNILFFGSVIFGSVFPDIDEPESYIGRRFPLLSNIFSLMGALTPTKFMEHRGFSHMLFLPLGIMYLAFTCEEQIFKIIIYGFAIGIFAHDCGDMLTKGGIRGFFFPLFPTRRIALLPRGLRFVTDSGMEWVFNLFLFIFCIGYYLNFTGVKFF